MAVHGTQGTGMERRSCDVHAEQLVAEWVHGTQARLQGGQLMTRTERSIGGKCERASWDGTIEPRDVVR
jgi:hypothetical protein